MRSPLAENRAPLFSMFGGKPLFHGPRSLLAIFLVCLLVPAATASAVSRSAAPGNVLILLSVEYGLPAYDIILSEIRGKLKTPSFGPVNLFAEYLDSARFPEDRYLRKSFESYKEKYANLKIDLLVAVGPNLVPIMEKYDASHFSRSPTVALDLLQSSEPIPAAFRKPNIAGLFLSIDVEKTIELALSLRPDTERIHVVAGTSKVDAYFEALAREAARPYESTVRFDYLNNLSMDDILSKAANLPDKSAILVLTTQTDAFGIPYYTRESTRLICERANAPVYVLFDSNSGAGGIGGFVHSFKRMGAKAGELALRILQGESPSAVGPIRTGPSHYILDWRQIQRWGIPEHRLPQGSVILHREVGFLENYKWHVMGASLFIIVQSLLIACLILLNRRQRKLSARLMAAEDRYRHLLRVERSSRVGELSASLAHEINQPLAAVLSGSQAALRFLRSVPLDVDKLREILQSIVDDNKRAAKVIHNMRKMLEREKAEKAPLWIDEVLNDVLGIFRGEAGFRKIAMETRCAPNLPPVMGNRSQLQQVMMNLIMNAADAVMPRAPQDRKIVVETRRNGDYIQVKVRDSGTGIEPAKMDKVFQPFFTTKIGGMGMGLALCQTIVEDHGGRIRMENNAGGGANASFDLPVIQNA